MRKIICEQKFLLSYFNIFIESSTIEKYKSLAKTILNRSKVSKQEFRDAIREVSMIEEEINNLLTLDV